MLKDADRRAADRHRLPPQHALNQEGGIDVEEARWETLVDRVNTTSAVWLGSTMGCAQCHNHKFDPFSQKDYYRMLAFFDNADYRVQGLGEEVMDKWIVEPELELPTAEQATRRAALRAEAERLRFELESKDLEAELEAFDAQRRAAAPAWTPLEAVRLRAKSGATLEDLARPVGARVGRRGGQGHLHRDRARGPPGDHGLPARGPARRLACPRRAPGGPARGPSS